MKPDQESIKFETSAENAIIWHYMDFIKFVDVVNRIKKCSRETLKSLPKIVSELKLHKQVGIARFRFDL